MESFRNSRQKKKASTQVVITLLVLLTSILLTQLLPGKAKQLGGAGSQTQWESSVVTFP